MGSARLPRNGECSFVASLIVQIWERAIHESEDCLTNMRRKMGPSPRYFFEFWPQNSVRIGQNPTFTAILVLSRILTAVFLIFASRFL